MGLTSIFVSVAALYGLFVLIMVLCLSNGHMPLLKPTTSAAGRSYQSAERARELNLYVPARVRVHFATCVAGRTLAQRPLLYSQWLIPALLRSNPLLLNILSQFPLTQPAKAPVTCLLLFTFPLGSSTPSLSCYMAHMLLLLLLFNPRAI